MATPQKDTIYVDIDDEVTGIIDKVQNSSARLVALVLPKRAGVFQSIVNMKLLKRAADASQKNLVLITSEAGLLPLAGAAGIYVAKTLNSKPEIPEAPQAFVDNDEPVEEDTGAESLPSDDEQPLDQTKPVSQLADSGTSPVRSPSKANDLETVTLDNSTPDTDAKAVSSKAAKTAKPKKDKSLKVPNFKRFRLILGIVALILVLLIIGFIVFSGKFAKATINISTSASNVPVNLRLVLSTSADTLNKDSGLMPAKYVSQEKTFTQTVATTGQKNEGNKASGTIQITECSSSGAPSNIPAGTGVSNNNQTYITQENTTFQTFNSSGFGNSYSKPCSNGSGTQYEAIGTTNIVAQNAGSAYNVSGVTFTVAGSSATGTGSASGGTDNIVQTVNQNDINNAKNKISVTNATGLKSSLASQLNGDGYYPIKATFNENSPQITPSAQVGDAASNVTVTETVVYSMYGVYKNDLKSMVASNVDNQINTNSQSILDYGLNSANYVVNSQSSSTAHVTMNTTAVAGPELNVNKIKSQAAGKKAGDIKSALMLNQNVTGVNVKISPFWTSNAPKNTAKIKVVIAKPTNK